MKCLVQYVVSALFICSLFAGCSKSLESEPLERVTTDEIFDPADKNADYAKQFLYGIYLLLPNGLNRVGGDFLDAGTDDAIPSRAGAVVDYFRNGGISPTNVVDDAWSSNYTGIRRVNSFLDKIGIVPLDSAQKSQFKGEARFLRAYFYFELVKRYGGVPLVGDRVFGLNDNVSLPRNTADECFSYIINELDAIGPLLIDAKVSDLNWARVSKGADLALKSRVLLYRASPLFNPDNELQKWIDAENAAKAVMDLGVYNLVTDYVQLFLDNKNSEMIFIKEAAQSQNVETSNGPIGYLVGNGYTSPSQNLVDAFLMTNGKQIYESGSGYDAANPYQNRDNRFDATIMYNGKTWLSRPVETFTGGSDRPGGVRVQTRTGYYLRKFMGKFEASGAYSNQNHHIVLFRYAETLLNYAEADNEVNGPGSTASPVYASLAAIRKRAGVEAGSDNLYGLPVGLTRDSMRRIIQNERRIELAFEEHRFWDIRRWKIAEMVMNQPVTGMNIVKQEGGISSYNRITASSSMFDAGKMYWYPIPFNERRSNPNLTQNPGWSY